MFGAEKNTVKCVLFLLFRGILINFIICEIKNIFNFYADLDTFSMFGWPNMDHHKKVAPQTR